MRNSLIVAVLAAVSGTSAQAQSAAVRAPAPGKSEAERLSWQAKNIVAGAAWRPFAVNADYQVLLAPGALPIEDEKGVVSVKLRAESVAPVVRGATAWRSVVGDFRVECDAKKYVVAGATYYSGQNLTGEPVASDDVDPGIWVVGPSLTATHDRQLPASVKRRPAPGILQAFCEDKDHRARNAAGPQTMDEATLNKWVEAALTSEPEWVHPIAADTAVWFLTSNVPAPVKGLVKFPLRVEYYEPMFLAPVQGAIPMLTRSARLVVTVDCAKKVFATVSRDDFWSRNLQDLGVNEEAQVAAQGAQEVTTAYLGLICPKS